MILAQERAHHAKASSNMRPRYRELPAANFLNSACSPATKGQPTSSSSNSDLQTASKRLAPEDQEGGGSKKRKRAEPHTTSKGSEERDSLLGDTAKAKRPKDDGMNINTSLIFEE